MDKLWSFFEKALASISQKENLLARIGSVIVACLLWVYVSVDTNPVTERTYDVRLNQTNLPTKMTVYNAPEKISVRVRGSKTDMQNRSGADISATVDFKNVTEGQQRIPVKVRTKMGKIVAVTPAEVSVYVDTISQKSVSVLTRMVGEAPEDLTLGNVKIKPKMVVIKGATHRIDKVNKVVAPVDVTDKNGNFEAESELVAVSDDGYDIPNMVITPSRVLVSAALVPQMLTVELPIELVTTGELPGNKVIKATLIEPKKVNLSASPSKLKGVTIVKTKPLDVSKLISGATPIVELDLPEKAISDVRIIKVHLELVEKGKEDGGHTLKTVLMLDCNLSS